MAGASRIVVVADSADEQSAKRAAQLADRLALQGVPVRDLPRMATAPSGPQPVETADLALGVTADRLELREATSEAGHGVCVDFAALRRKWVRQRGGLSKRQPLARAMGRGAGLVLDATAGLGHDALMLALMGFRVVAVERSAVIFALLQDALRRACADRDLQQAIGDRLSLRHDDARRAVTSGEFDPDAVYIDPMFPAKRKSSALAKKSIRLVRAVVGDDQDAGELLALARRVARRVVVKRADDSPPLAGEPNGDRPRMETSSKPSATITGKLVRYDIYISG